MNAGTEVPCSFRLALLAVAVFAVAVFAVCGASDADAYSGEALEKDGMAIAVKGGPNTEIPSAAKAIEVFLSSR